MKTSSAVQQIPGPARPLDAGAMRSASTSAAVAATGLLLALATLAARAADGCQVLLCLSAPDWRSVPQCVPPVKQVLHDLARGKPFPSCDMAGSGNSASHAWASAPGDCPPQYTHVEESESGRIYSCDYTGAISVSINGAPFSRTWWSLAGATVTDFSPAAKSQLGSWDTRFDDDYEAWLSALPNLPASDRSY